MSVRQVPSRLGRATDDRTETPSDALGRLDIFHDLSPRDLATLAEQTQVRRIPKGSIVYTQRVRAEACFLLVEGRVRLCRLTSSGKRLELATIEPGTFFGAALPAGGLRDNGCAEATEESLLVVIRPADLEQIIRQRPQVALRMLEVLSRRLARTEVRLEEMAYGSVPARTAAVLMRLSQDQADDTIVVTHRTLGGLVGALRETVTKILDEFRAAGLVELGRGRVVLRDLAGLKARLEHL
jgi:CRP/FNR family transcriptional regulator